MSLIFGRRGGSGGLGSSVYTSAQIILVGDSITTGFGGPYNNGRLTNQLNAAFDGVHECYTNGQSGGFLWDGSPDQLTAFQTSPAGAAYTYSKATQLKILIIHIATNDLAADGTLPQSKIDTGFAALQTLVGLAKTAGYHHVLYSNVIPRGFTAGTPEFYEIWNDYIDDHVAEITGLDGVIDNRNIPYYDAEADTFETGYRTIPPFSSADTIHPGEKGNFFIANNWAGEVRKIVGRYPNIRKTRYMQWSVLPNLHGVWLPDGIQQSGGTITSWNDTRTANGFDFNSVTGAPQYSATGGPYGNPCAVFDGDDCIDMEAAGLNCGRNVGKVSIVMAVKVDTIQRCGFIAIGRGTTGTNYLRGGLGIETTGGNQWDSHVMRLDSDSPGQGKTLTPTPATHWMIHGCHNDYDNDNYQMEINGATVYTDTGQATKGKTSDTNSTHIRIGARGSASSKSSFLIGKIAGFCILNDATMGDYNIATQLLNDELQGIYNNWREK